jgi:hypothetical protein
VIEMVALACLYPAAVWLSRPATVDPPGVQPSAAPA